MSKWYCPWCHHRDEKSNAAKYVQCRYCMTWMEKEEEDECPEEKI
jgi:hypothetical protein